MMTSIETRTSWVVAFTALGIMSIPLPTARRSWRWSR
jgi:hypothetical protein